MDKLKLAFQTLVSTCLHKCGTLTSKWRYDDETQLTSVNQWLNKNGLKKWFGKSKKMGPYCQNGKKWKKEKIGKK